MPSRFSRTCAALLAVLALAACKDSNAPRDPLGIRSVIVTPRVDSIALRDRGELTLALVPVDGRGEAIISDTLTIRPALSGVPLPVLSTTPSNPGTLGVSAAVLLDNSGSMRDNDPDDLRLEAAQLFFEQFLSLDGRNQGALLSFSGLSTTPGFTTTRLHQTWTSSSASLAAALTTTDEGGTSRLYGSAAETIRWMDSTRAENVRRVLLVFTDALPTDTTISERLFTAAADAGVVVHAVGVGPASDLSSNTSPEAVARLRAIANETGGLYAGAPSAEGLAPVFSALGTSVGKGELLVTVKLDPAPARGTVLRGYVDVSNPAGGARGNWEVTAP